MPKKTQPQSDTNKSGQKDQNKNQKDPNQEVEWAKRPTAQEEI